MEVDLLKTKMIPGDPDMSFQIGETAREWGAKLEGNNMVLFEVLEREKFYYPINANYRGCLREMKFLTYPGEGYVPDKPWCTFDTDYTFNLNIFLDLTPYIR